MQLMDSNPVLPSAKAATFSTILTLLVHSSHLTLSQSLMLLNRIPMILIMSGLDPSISHMGSPQYPLRRSNNLSAPSFSILLIWNSYSYCCLLPFMLHDYDLFDAKGPNFLLQIDFIMHRTGIKYSLGKWNKSLKGQKVVFLWSSRISPLCILTRVSETIAVDKISGFLSDNPVWNHWKILHVLKATFYKTPGMFTFTKSKAFKIW